MTARQKTDTAVNVPLLKVPQAILKKYEGKLPNGLLLPVLSNQKLNSYLKEIGDLCGIGKNITFHCTRHFSFPFLLKRFITFANIMFFSFITKTYASEKLRKSDFRIELICITGYLCPPFPHFEETYLCNKGVSFYVHIFAAHNIRL